MQGAVTNLQILLGRRLTAVRFPEDGGLLIDGRIEKEGMHHRRRAIDGDGDAGVWCTEVETGIELLHVVNRADRHTALPHLAIDVGRKVGILAIERDAVEGSGEAFGIIVLAEVVEPAVGPFGRTLSSKLALGILFGTLERENTRCKRKVTRSVLKHAPSQNFAKIGKAGQANFRNSGTGERGRREIAPDFAPSDHRHELVALVGIFHRRPLIENRLRLQRQL